MTSLISLISGIFTFTLIGIKLILVPFIFTLAWCTLEYFCSDKDHKIFITLFSTALIIVSFSLIWLADYIAEIIHV